MITVQICNQTVYYKNLIFTINDDIFLYVLIKTFIFIELIILNMTIK